LQSVADTPPQIPDNGKRLQDFIPGGYTVFEKLKLDLNGDGRKDIAVVLSAEPDSPEPRPLLILLARKGGDYRLLARSDKLAPQLAEMGSANANGGGVLSREGKVLIITRSGGSSPNHFSDRYMFRFQENDFYLIGKVHEDLDPDRSCDVNALAKNEFCYLEKHTIAVDLRTGDRVESWIKYGEGKPTKSRLIRSRLQGLKPISFAEYKPELDKGFYYP
jgi:hypothetical protein